MMTKEHHLDLNVTDTAEEAFSKTLKVGLRCMSTVRSLFQRISPL